MKKIESLNLRLFDTMARSITFNQGHIRAKLRAISKCAWCTEIYYNFSIVANQRNDLLCLNHSQFQVIGQRMLARTNLSSCCHLVCIEISARKVLKLTFVYYHYYGSNFKCYRNFISIWAFLSDSFMIDEEEQ